MPHFLKKENVLYFYTAESPFVEKDIEILNRQFHLARFFFNVYNKKQIFNILFSQLFFLMRKTAGSKVIICQFAGLHAVLPVLFSKLFLKKSVIISGGTDCVSFPSINYGNFSNKKNAAMTRFCFKNASLILPVHQSLIFCDYTYQPNDYRHQGIRQFIPGLKTRSAVVHNGYDSAYWHNNQPQKTSRSFVTVLGHVNSKFTLFLKGIDLYIEMARKFPDAIFTVIGGASLVIEDQPVNLKLVSNIWGSEMVNIFSAHQFYVQLSMSEGFPNALSEAMLCECVPIVSAVGGMPDIVSGCGYILHHKNPEELVLLFEKALADPEPALLGKKARSRVAENYTVAKRERLLLHEITSLIT